MAKPKQSKKIKKRPGSATDKDKQKLKKADVKFKENNRIFEIEERLDQLFEIGIKKIILHSDSN